MNISLHIERLILDGVPPGLDPARLSIAVQEELARMLAETGLLPSLAGGGAFASVAGGEIVTPGDHPESLGAQIAMAIHAGLGRQDGGSR